MYDFVYITLLLREAIPKQICFCVNFFQGGGGGVGNHVRIQNISRHFFCSCLDIFQEGEGGVPHSKPFEELFFLSLDIF